MEAKPPVCICFVSSVHVDTFIGVNIFIAVIVDNLEESKAARVEHLVAPPLQEEILDALQATRAALRRLEERLAVAEPLRNHRA